VSAYTIPTDAPESDCTFEWNSTTMVFVEIAAGGESGIGWSYADVSTAKLIHTRFVKLLAGADAMSIDAAWARMLHDIRNIGRPGVVAMAISAVDNALWDLKAKLLALPLVRLIGQVRESVPVYGSGGFTSYTVERLRTQLGGWASDDGMRFVKMKIGRDAAADRERVRAAKDAIGACALFVDANGAYTRKQALAQAEDFAESDVRWFEEPVGSDDLDGLRLIRDRAPAGMDIAAGEYGYDHYYFRRMLQAGAVDVLQADATRCCGISGFLRASALCESFNLPLSAHCAPSMHLHAGCAALPLVHLEYFHDHARIESMLFDGFCAAKNGVMTPDLSRPGHGLELKRKDAERYVAL